MCRPENFPPVPHRATLQIDNKVDENLLLRERKSLAPDFDNKTY